MMRLRLCILGQNITAVFSVPPTQQHTIQIFPITSNINFDHVDLASFLYSKITYFHLYKEKVSDEEIL